MEKDYSCQKLKKIIFKEKGKIHQVDAEIITHIVREDYLTTIHIKGNLPKITTTQPLTLIEKRIIDLNFFRISRNCIINLCNVSSFDSTKRYITINESTRLCVSRSKCCALRQYF